MHMYNVNTKLWSNVTFTLHLQSDVLNLNPHSPNMYLKKKRKEIKHQAKL